MDKINALTNVLEALYPYKLIVEDESRRHANHYTQNGSSEFPSHVKITVVCADFANLSLIARQRLVNRILADAYENGLHSASIKAYSIDEFKEQQRARAFAIA